MIERALQRRPRAGDERGFTLVELLTAMTIGLVVLGSATMITIGAARHNTQVASRVEATQRGRLAMDRFERTLRSQVCVTTSKYPLADAQIQSVTFFADLSDGSQPVERHTIAYDAAARSLTDTTVVAGPDDSFTGTPQSTVLATDVDPPADGQMLRYYAYPTVAPTDRPLQPDVALSTPVAGDDLGRVSRIDISFLTTGERQDTRNITADMRDQVFVRLARPNDTTSPSPVYNPTCT